MKKAILLGFLILIFSFLAGCMGCMMPPKEQHHDSPSHNPEESEQSHSSSHNH